MSDRDIAIVGIGCKFPGIDKVGDYMNVLDKKEVHIKSIPSNRGVAGGFSRSKDYFPNCGSNKGGWIHDIGAFDPVEFDIPPEASKYMSIQRKHLLEVTRDAFDDFGGFYRGTDMGVFVGATSQEFSIITASNPNCLNENTLLGIMPCMLANYLSFYFDLLGPSLVTDTACASSISSLQQAVMSLRSGQCSQALVCGSNVSLLRSISTVAFNMLDAISQTGELHAFDEKSNGTVRGEGFGAIVLKRLNDAERDNDKVYAIIKGVATGHSGWGNGNITAPSAEAQKSVIKAAYRDAELEPNQVYYVECHGTGTLLGDRTEANAVGELCSSGRKSSYGPVRIGSVKTNFGHSEAAAGIASLIKAAKMLSRKELAPQAGFTSRNKRINWEEYNLKIQLDAEEIKRRDAIISVSSFGLGGVNGHVVLQSYQPLQKQKSLQFPSFYFKLFILGGESKASVEMAKSRWKNIRLNDAVAESLMSTRAKNYTWRSIAVSQKLNDADFGPPMYIPRTRQLEFKVVYVLSGQGSQQKKMGHQLYAEFPVFRETFEKFCSAVQRAKVKLEDIKNNEIVNFSTLDGALAITAYQVSIIELLRFYGVHAAAVIGHSLGEVSAFYACGCMNIEETAFLAVCRNVTTPHNYHGAMAALAMSNTDALRHISQYYGGTNPNIWVACDNSPKSVTIAGLNDDIDDFLANIPSKKKKLASITKAHHTPLMDGSKKELLRRINVLFPNYEFIGERPKVDFMSTVTGNLYTSNVTPEHVWLNVGQKVLFNDGITRILQKYPNATFVQIGKKTILENYLRELGVKDKSIVAVSNTKDEHEAKALLKGIGKLSQNGFNNYKGNISRADITSNDRDQAPEYSYPNKQRNWVPSSNSLYQSNLGRLPHQGPLTCLANGQGLCVWDKQPSWIKDHRIDGNIIMPVAATIEMMLECGLKELYHFDTVRPIIFTANNRIELDVSIQENKVSIQENKVSIQENKYKVVIVKSRPVTTDWKQPSQKWSINCNSKIIKKISTPIIPPFGNRMDVKEVIRKNFPVHDITSTKKFYLELEKYKYQYGPFFQCVKDVFTTRDSLTQLAHLKAPCDLDLQHYCFHPALLDSAIHVSLVIIKRPGILFLPKSIHRFRMVRDSHFLGTPEELYVHTEIVDFQTKSCTQNIWCYDKDGALFCEIIRLKLDAVATGRSLCPLWTISQKLADEIVEPQPDLIENIIYFHCNDGFELQIAKYCNELEQASIVTSHVIQRRSIPRLFLCANEYTNEKRIGLAEGFGRVLCNEYQAKINVHVIVLSSGLKLNSDSDVETWIEENLRPRFHTLETEIHVTNKGDLLYPRWEKLESIPKVVIEKTIFNPRKSYLIIGGLGSLGTRITEWMFTQGARHVVLTSRRGKVSLLQEALFSDFIDKGFVIRVEKVDASDVEKTKSLIKRFGNDFPELGGVMALAMVLNDRTVPKIEKENIESVYKAKVIAADILIECLRNCGWPVDFLIFASSISSVVGSPGQALYSAANAYLDRLVHNPNYLRTASLNLSLISDTHVAVGEKSGILSDMSNVGGVGPITTTQICRFLEDFIPHLQYSEDPIKQVVLVNLDAQRSLQLKVMKDRVQAILKEQLKNKTSCTTEQESVRSTLATLIGIPVDKLDSSTPLNTVGLDSLRVISIRIGIRNILQIEVSENDLMNGITVGEIINLVKKKTIMLEIDVDKTLSKSNSKLEEKKKETTTTTDKTLSKSNSKYEEKKETTTTTDKTLSKSNSQLEEKKETTTTTTTTTTSVISLIQRFQKTLF